MPARDILDHSLIDDYNRQVSSSGNARRLILCPSVWVDPLVVLVSVA